MLRQNPAGRLIRHRTSPPRKQGDFGYNIQSNPCLRYGLVSYRI